MGSPSHREYQRLFDYFGIIGLDPDGGLEPNHIQGAGHLVPPLERSFGATVLGYYPDAVPGALIDTHALQMLCLPKGLQLRTQKQRLDPVYHPFLITREDGSRCYGFAYTFYEEVNSTRICTALHGLQSAYLAEISNNQSAAGGDSSAALSASGTPSKGAGGEARRDTRSLPREFRWSSPKSGAARLFYDVTKDQLFVSKCIALLGRHPEVGAAEKFLVGLYKLFTQCEGGAVTLESHVHNLLYEVHAPPPGRCLGFYCVNRPHICYRPTAHDLPLMLYPLRTLFSLLSPECVVQLLSCVLLENQVLLVASDPHRLMLVAESLSSLLFPFAWQHVYVPLLPAALSHFLDAPVPFIMGISVAPAAKKEIAIPDEANLCLVDVDVGAVDVPEDLPLFPHGTEFIAELTKLLKKWELMAPQSRTLDSSGDPLATTKHHFDPLLELTHSHNLRDIAAFTKKGVYDKESLKQALISNGFGKDSSKESVMDISPQCPEAKEFLEMLQFNSAVREVFLNRFVQMFSTYDHFIIQPNVQETTMDAWLSTRESLQNFDKATFLSDQPAAHLPFLSRFIESQMFASFIDHKILSFWGEVDNNQHLFDARIRQLRERVDETAVRTPTYEPCTTATESAAILDKRLSRIDYLVPPPAPMDPSAQHSCTHFNPGHFPLLDRVALNKEPHRSRKQRGSWRRRERQAQHLQHTALSAQQKDQVLNEAKTLHPAAQPKLADMAPALMAHTNWKFVEQLLKECKTRSKRMLVEKMGAEAVELGHQEASLVGVEENTLVASLCHLLERVWAHGLQAKQGKSALWSHLLSYREQEVSCGNPADCDSLSPAAPSDCPLRPPSEDSLSPLPDILGLLRVAHWALLGERALHFASTKELSTMALETESAPASPTHGPHTLGGHSPPRQSSTGPRPKHHSTSSASNSLRKNSISSGNLYERGARLISGSHNNLSSSSSLRPSSAESSPHALSTFSSPFSSSSSQSLNHQQQQVSLPSLPVAVTFDMKNVLAMTEVKTEIGYARAWLRLSLEKKLLSVHLATLLSDAELLRSLYKRYAFLRCDDEKEQFLSYILSLNAVDYYCFTNTYTTTKLPYRVILFTSRKMSAATTTANAWVSLAGSLGHTSKIPLTRTHQNQMVFQHKNLGLLSTLRLGHDNHGLSPKWLVEHVLVRNEVTGHTWRFPCGRWLGRGIDDGSLERVLVGEMVPHGLSADALLQSCRTPPRCRSPHPPGGMRKDLRLTVPEMQQLLGDAVNNLVKFFYKTEKERGSLTPLLCGDLGLVACLELVFGYGFKSSRFFGKNLYLWDYLERVEQEFSSWLREEREREQLSGLAREGASAGHARRRAVLLIDRINKRTTLLGKDDKFQLFMCIAARERLLHRLLLPLHQCNCTYQLYEETSFLRDPQLLRDLINVLAALADFDIVLEDSLTRGIDG